MTRWRGDQSIVLAREDTAGEEEKQRQGAQVDEWSTLKPNDVQQYFLKRQVSFCWSLEFWDKIFVLP